MIDQENIFQTFGFNESSSAANCLLLDILGMFSYHLPSFLKDLFTAQLELVDADASLFT